MHARTFGGHPSLEPLDGGHGSLDLCLGADEAWSGPGPPRGADEPALADPRAARWRECEVNGGGGGEAGVDGH